MSRLYWPEPVYILARRSLASTKSGPHGLAFLGIYTWGKSLDALSSSSSRSGGNITSGNQNGPVIQNGDLPAQRGRSDFDIRQQFAADGTWTTPSHYDSAVERGILGGWQFGGVWIMQTGLPFWVYTTAGFAPICSGGATPVNSGAQLAAPLSVMPGATTTQTEATTMCRTSRLSAAT